MAELIPSLNTCLPKMTAGEKRLARRLLDLLEDDYLIWYDIPLGKHRRYPDFIVMHPSRGLLFLEVKDWLAPNIKKITHTSVDLLTDTGIKSVPNPIEQARQTAYQVINQLECDPQLKSRSGQQQQGKLSFPYGYGVIFPMITRAQLNTGMPEEMRSKMLPDHLLICKDEMLETTTAEKFQEQLWGMFNYQFGNKLTLPQIDRIRWHLFPEIRIHEQQGTFFNEDTSKAAQTNLSEQLPELIKIMDIQQEQLARSLGDGHRVIHGVAGSGKTLILGYRCLQLAQVLHQPILVLCFNITLAARLRLFIQAKGIGEKVQVYHFHDWCGEQLRAYHVDVIKSDAPNWERQVSSVIAGVENGQIPKGQYGALLIDEGHDFEPEWLALITQMVDPQTNSMLLLYDDAQSIYKHKSRRKFTLASVGIQAQGRTTILKLNYRNTREILHFAYEFAKEYFTQNDDADIPLVEPQVAGRNGEAPTIKKFASIDEEVAYGLRCLQQWQKSGVSWRDIAILYPGGTAGTRMAKALKQADIPFFWLATSSNKKHYQPAENRVSLMPIPSSKGLEFETVLIIDSTFIPNRVPAEKADSGEEVRKLYVGLTRARSNLLISYHRDNAISAALIKKQNNEKLLKNP
ncbi:MAG: 3'-5' exonuclease [Pseudomonadota bacterium]